MARPLEFDKITALNAATKQFWADGFEASSVQKLLDAMGINRGSLYSSFGDKETLFRQSLDNYEAMLTEHIEKTLVAVENPMEAIQQFLTVKYSAASKKKLANGCMLVNTISELSNVNKKLANLAARKKSKLIEGALRLRLAEAKKSGQLSGDVDEVTEYFMTLYTGLEMRGKVHKDKASLERTVSFAFSCL
ncbi:TetR family transcriptional regulator [Sinobacterium caligoides]|uniref:TetR family transcriptional regulator n=1 Tax=Sinobacterium caligoides TaxID=933926 RepID=A0A3N2DJP7_9GAMM|nr:TetR/AcrR family transcriptional regulator [Sinobacterium caligoides]ROS00006.1 TetR family transcriptional regulator [Sinobacterium caligoides]